MLIPILWALPLIVPFAAWLIWRTCERPFYEGPATCVRFMNTWIYSNHKVAHLRIGNRRTVSLAMVSRARYTNENHAQITATLKKRPFREPYVTRVRWVSGAVESVYPDGSSGVMMAWLYISLTLLYALFGMYFMAAHLAWMLSGAAAIMCGLSLNLFRFRDRSPFNMPLSIFGVLPYGSYLPAWCAGILVLSVVATWLFLTASHMLLILAGYFAAFELGSLIGYLLGWAWLKH